MTSIVQTENLTVEYGSVTAVDNVNIEVNQGEILGIVGPNGAGKTALFRAILGLQPYRGRVTLFGQDHTMRKHLLPFVGYVPQKMAFEPTFPATVFEVVSMGIISKRTVRGAELIRRGEFRPVSLSRESSGDAERVTKSLEAVGMDHLADRRIGSLSGGEQQRAFIAQSLVRDPLLMILDEPVTSMDVESQAAFYSILRRANRDHGITVVVSLHDLEMLKEHSDRVACMNCQLCYHGDTETFFADEDCLRMYTEASMQAHLNTHHHDHEGGA